MTVIPSARVKSAEGFGASGTVDDPMISAVAAGARAMGVPDGVVGEPPGTKVCDPNTRIEEGLWVKPDLPGSVIAASEVGLSGMVEDPIIIAVAEGTSDIRMPETMRGELPGIKVCASITNAEEGSAVIGVPKIMMMGAIAAVA